MNGVGYPVQWVGYGMNNVLAEHSDIAAAQRGSTRRLHPSARVARQSSPVDIILATSVDADDGAVTMVVRQRPLPKTPDAVEDGQLLRAYQHLSERGLVLTKGGN